MTAVPYRLVFTYFAKWIRFQYLYFFFYEEKLNLTTQVESFCYTVSEDCKPDESLMKKNVGCQEAPNLFLETLYFVFQIITWSIRVVTFLLLYFDFFYTLVVIIILQI